MKYKNLIFACVAIDFLVWLLNVSFTAAMPSWFGMFVFAHP